MPKKSKALTKLELKNPIGERAKSMCDKTIVEELIDIDFLTTDLQITQRGSEYAMAKLSCMDNVQRIMIEKFILDYHNLDVSIDYNNKL